MTEKLRNYIKNSKNVLLSEIANYVYVERLTKFEWSVNIHKLIDFIISQSGRYCDAHCSDILFGINRLKDELANGKIEHDTFVFAIRRYGVDGMEQLANNIEYYPQYFTYGYYRAIYAITLTHTTNEYTDNPQLQIELKDITNVSVNALG